MHLFFLPTKLFTIITWRWCYFSIVYIISIENHFQVVIIKEFYFHSYQKHIIESQKYYRSRKYLQDNNDTDSSVKISLLKYVYFKDNYFQYLFQNTCRTLYCLWNSLSFGGKCLPFLGYTNRLSYQLVVKLVPQTIITYSDLREDGFRNIYSHVLEKLNFIHCNMCHLALYAERFGQEMYVNFTFIPTSRCKIEDIWSKFIAAEANLPLYLNLTLNETHIAFNASWDYPDFYKEYTILLSLGMTSDCHIFTPAPGQICPKVKLLKHEVETVMKYHPRAEELRWVQNEKDINGSTFVCIYNYIPNQHSSKLLNSQSSFLVTFIITVMSWMLTTAGML